MATKITTGKVRFSYCYIFEARPPIDNSGDPKYSVTLLIPKSDTATVNAIRAAIQEARDAFCAKNGSNALPPKPNHTLHDGDGLRESGEEFGPECKGCYVLKASSKDQPIIVDAFRQPITNSAEVYSGCYGRASIKFFGYNKAGSKGVSCALLAIQKLSDGEPLGTMGSAEDFNDGYDAGDDNDFPF